MYQIQQAWRFWGKVTFLFHWLQSKQGSLLLPLCEKSVPLLNRSLAQGMGKAGSNSHFYYSFRNGRQEWVSSFMWQIWNAFQQVSQGLVQPVSPSLSLFHSGATATKPVIELPTTLSPAEHTVFFVPSSKPIQLLLQPGNKSYNQGDQQIPAAWYVQLLHEYFTPEPGKDLLSCQLFNRNIVTGSSGSNHSQSPLCSLPFLPFCQKHCTHKFYFYSECCSPQKSNACSYFSITNWGNWKLLNAQSSYIKHLLSAFSFLSLAPIACRYTVKCSSFPCLCLLHSSILSLWNGF